MALTITPGGSSDDAMVSFAAVTAYATAHGLTWTVDTALGEPAIRRASAWLSTAFSWKGYKLNGRSQSQAFPRIGVVDGEGHDVDPDTIPVEIQSALCEASVYELANSGGLSPVVVLTDRIKSESIAGAISTEYVVSNMSVEASRPVLLKVRELVSGLVSGASNPLVGSAARA